MDASVTPLRHGGLSLVQTTDFFYPLVDDPYMQGMDCTSKLSLEYKTVDNFIMQVKLLLPMC